MLVDWQMWGFDLHYWKAPIRFLLYHSYGHFKKRELSILMSSF